MIMIDSSWQKNYPPLEKITENLDDNSSLAKLLSLISENTRVIDFGCATGYLAYLLKQKGCVVTGVEINEQAASIAEEYCERVIVCDLDITRLLDILPKQTFDVAVFGDVLEHLRDPWRILQETKELLLPQGYVVASIPNIAHGAIRLSLLQGKFDYQELGILDNTHLRFFTRKTVEELFEKSGYLSEIVDRTHLPVLENSPLIPSLELNHLDNKLVEEIQNARETDTLQFIVRAFPASVENQYNFLKTKFLENYNLLESSQSELQQTKGLLESSQSELQQTRDWLDRYQVWIDAMESSKFWKLRTKWFDVKYALGLDRPEKHQKPENYKSEETFNIDYQSSAFQLFIDLAILVPNLGIYAEGWIFDPKNEIQALTFVTEREEVDVKSTLAKKNRPDLVPYIQSLGISNPPEDLGFFVLCPLSDTSNVTELQLEVQLQSGDTVDYKAGFLKLPSDPLPVIQNMLTYCTLPNYRMRSILNNHIGSTVRTLWKSRERPEIEKIVREYGVQVENPEVSIIVPLYGRIDFLKYQLALFADDPDLKQNELIYVLDDPRSYDEFLYLCDSQSSIFEVPFKTVYTGINQGYAGANNSGVSIARGRLLLLLNSDVMPIRTGWLSSLVNVYDSLTEENVGVIGPKLLYGNGSIQHAGMKFVRYGLWDNFWINDHPNKGQPNFSESNSRPKKISAVTGACMMVTRELYDQVSGLDEEYIAGDYEDSDFCLKLHAQGRENYYIPHIELFHLERQSLSLSQTQEKDDLWKFRRSLYNCWLYNHKWEEYILKNNL
ncbi:MAG: methyltransferase domain-containing protein [Microcystis sp.]|uniref:methyltransferase domain-containing protein n=2 Tax=Microcystis TaxID=1125 RepID=UPI00391C2D75